MGRGKDDPEWFTAMYKASETGILDQGELEAMRKAMGPDRYEQEIECSFEAAVVGAYWGQEMKELTEGGKVTSVPYDPALPVITSFDLGVGDSTAIWFAQKYGTETRFIDYYENNGVGLDHYAQVLADKGYYYESHILPHDVQVRELGTGHSRSGNAGRAGRSSCRDRAKATSGRWYSGGAFVVAAMLVRCRKMQARDRSAAPVSKRL